MAFFALVVVTYYDRAFRWRLFLRAKSRDTFQELLRLEFNRLFALHGNVKCLG